MGEIAVYQNTAGLQYPAGFGFSTIMADMDFETYSEAGYVFNESTNKWGPIAGTKDKGLPAIGAAAYSEHESTEVLCLCYDLKEGQGPRIWIPGMEAPLDLFQHIATGQLIEAHNSMFEFLIWTNVCRRLYGWPELPLEQLRCSAAKCRAFSLPGKLEKAGEALDSPYKKLKDGKRLIDKFSCPRNPTAKKPYRRMLVEYDHVDAARLYEYCFYDIKTEASISNMVPDLIPVELDMWLLDQKINYRGCAVDLESIKACTEVVNQAFAKYEVEIVEITGGEVQTVGELKKITAWCAAKGFVFVSLDADHIKAALKREDLTPEVRRVLELRALLGAASVKKLFSMLRRVCRDGRLRDLLLFCGADRTGRFAGRGPQPQNLPNSGPTVMMCESCGATFGLKFKNCICHCGGVLKKTKWSIEAVDSVLGFINKTRGDLTALETVMGDDPIGVISGCLRGLFCAGEGKDLLCSDYSAIEAVVLAALAGEQWRLDVFHTHGKIYEESASKITGTPFEEFMSHAGYNDLSIPEWWLAEQTGEHHPLRKSIGKFAELASGFQGGLGAWKAFGADEFLTDDEIKDAVKIWRKDSPNIVKFWYGLEDAAKSAVQNPGYEFEFRGFWFKTMGDALFVQLLSGRKLCYHAPRLTPDVTPWGKSVLKLSYMGIDSYTKKWCRLETYGGKLCENIVQATARDILTNAIVNLENAGYPVVLHIHDEIVSEVPAGTGDVAEFERIMESVPQWCASWPIKAAGGWRGKRYRKG